MGVRMEGNVLPNPDTVKPFPGKVTVTANEDSTGRFDTSSDELLIRRAFLSSPEEGCELLFRRYHRALCNHALRLCILP